MSKSKPCAWCGVEVGGATQEHPTSLCPECNETYESEASLSLHPMEERQPHQD